MSAFKCFIIVMTFAEVGPCPCSAAFDGRCHRLSSHRRSTFHFPFVLSLFSTHLVSIPQLHVHYLTLCFPHVGVRVCIYCLGRYLLAGIVCRVRYYARYLQVTGNFTHL
jgi:hypothetical protein